MNVWSGAGLSEVYPLNPPGYANLANGNRLTISIMNTGTGDVSGTIDVECAHARHDDACMPDNWGPLPAPIDCGAALTFNMAGGQTQIEIPAHDPMRSGEQCQFSIPCPCQFLRLANVPADLVVTAVVDRLKRTGGPAIPVPQPCP